MRTVVQFLFNLLDKFSGHIIIPFQSVEKSFKLDLKDKEIKDGDGDIIGKVFTSSFNCGIAMIDKEKIISSKNPKFKIDDLNTVIIDPNTLWDSVREVEQNS